jgi:hypothetical protein
MSYEWQSNLASRCQGVAMNLSYNNGELEDLNKRTLIEASRCIDGHCIRVHRKRDGLLMITARGKSRFMTWRERIAYWLLEGKTEMRP